MRWFDRVVEKIEDSDALDEPSERVSGIADKVIGAPLVRDALSGTWLGHPLHPLLVTVPIGAWVSASVLDVTKGSEEAARRLIGLGILAAVPTAAAGASDWRYTSGRERRVGLVHSLANQVGLALYGASWLARGRNRNAVGVLLALGGAGAVSVGGYLGGHLTYARGVGVDTTAFTTGPKDWTRVATLSDLTKDAMIERNVDGVSVLVTRVGGEVVALANRCSHRGGPLNEGTREDDCVRCPWHQSAFSLVDGEVREGPATRPQDTYEVRVAGKDIEIRSARTADLQSEPVGS